MEDDNCLDEEYNVFCIPVIDYIINVVVDALGEEQMEEEEYFMVNY